MCDLQAHSFSIHTIGIAEVECLDYYIIVFMIMSGFHHQESQGLFV
jgi:hypothetical protein